MRKTLLTLTLFALSILNIHAQDGYKMAKVRYNYEEDSYSLDLVEWKEKEEEQKGLKQTKPHTLRSVFSRAATINDKLYVFHNLCQRDPSMGKQMIKNPIRVADFQKQTLFNIKYLNDDSTGNKRGEEKEVKEPILP